MAAESAVAPRPGRPLRIPTVGMLALANQPVVLRVRPDPEPHDVLVVLDAERPVV
jgi:hypothetical protein